MSPLKLKLALILGTVEAMRYLFFNSNILELTTKYKALVIMSAESKSEGSFLPSILGISFSEFYSDKSKDPDLSFPFTRTHEKMKAGSNKSFWVKIETFRVGKLRNIYFLN